MGRFSNIAFTPRVKTEQERMGSRRAYARADGTTEPDALGDDEAAFLAARDSFYMASVGETGWPYIQHRGGPKGFVKVIADAKTGEIYGAHIIGSEATELIAEYGLAMELEATVESIHGTIHAHPTLSEAVMEAAAASLGEAIHI